MKRIGILLLMICMIGTIMGCSQTEEKKLGKYGISPYAITEEEEQLLSALALEHKASIFSFQVPPDAKTLIVHTYVLGEDNTWQDMGGGMISTGDDDVSQKEMQGTLSMIEQKNGIMEFHVSTSGRYSFQTEDLWADNTEYRASTKDFITDFTPIVIGQEIPVALFMYDNGTTMESSTVADFFSIEKFQDMDMVQAVTVTFSDKDISDLT